MHLPGAPFIARRGGELFIEDRSLAQLADEHGTPLFVYSRRSMRRAAADYQRAFAGRAHLICYALKANSNLAVLQTFAESGCGFDIVSGGELSRVLAARGDPAKVVFSGVGKSANEMRQALAAGVRCFNVESAPELQRLSGVAHAAGVRAPVSLRVNPDVDAQTHPYISTGLKNNKFGIDHEHALDLYRHAAHMPGIEVTGIACHIGSQITAVAPYLDALERVLDLVQAVEAEGISLRHLDLGGGLGITYTDEQPPRPDELVQSLLERIDARGHRHREVILAPGRSMVGNAGVLVTAVQVLKPGAHKNFCIVDAAMNDVLRPAMYGAYMGIVPVVERSDATRRWDVVGPVCESGDWLGRDRDLALREGDLVAMLSAGAYCMAMASNYNSRPRAAEVMVDGERAWLIREREQAQQLYAGERLIG